MPLVATCAPENVAGDGTCSAVVWVDESSLGWLPELSSEDGGLIGGALFALMAVAWLLRKARRTPA